MAVNQVAKRTRNRDTKPIRIPAETHKKVEMLRQRLRLTQIALIETAVDLLHSLPIEDQLRAIVRDNQAEPPRPDKEADGRK